MTLERMRERACERARSGKFSGWRSVAFELQLEPGLMKVFRWLHSALKTPFSGFTVDRRKKSLTVFVTKPGSLFIVMVPNSDHSWGFP